MKLDQYRSLWGACREDWPMLFGQLKENGFAGVEASLGDIGYPNDTQPFFDLLKEHSMSWICGVYSGWVDYEYGAWTMESVEDHVNRFKSQLEAVPSLPVQPVHVNCHTGSDHFTYEESLDLFKQVLDFQSQSPLKSISHETHRGRVLYSPFTTLRLLKQFPTLRLTLDISHWNVVSERLIDPKILSPIFDRVDHIHARVGSHESPQVDDTRERDGNYQKFTLYHENIWKQVWKAQREAGRQVSTLTPEYGPAEDGYMPSMLRISSEGKKERVPLGKLDELIVSEYHELQKTFDAASE